jgi:phosphotransferase system HPr-like phosphotransfer protein
MEKLSINFKEIVDVEKFIKVAGKYDFDVTLSQGKYDVDGKSLMGIFSLDITKPVELLVDDKGMDTSKFFEEIREYIAK